MTVYVEELLVFFIYSTVRYYECVVLLIDEGYKWEKTEDLEKNLSQCQFVHYICHMDCPGVKIRPLH
jgi:hypothetical protein